ncbi:MAG TPA: MCP four helix bundle domain-containing protein, partial [Albitalea sp.]
MNLIHLLRRFTIRTRMLGAIAMVMALLCGVGGAGLLGLSHVAAIGQRFVDETHGDTVTLAELRNALADLRRHEKDMVINYEKPDRIAALMPMWNKAAGEVRRHARRIAERGAGEGAAAGAQIDTLLAAYSEKAMPVLNQIMAGGYDTATVADRMLAKAKESIEQAEEQIRKLQGLLEAEAQAAVAARAAALQRAYLLFGAVVVLAIAIVVPLTLANMWSITRPLEKAKTIAGRIATGDLTGEVESSGSDESAALMRSLAQMQDGLRALVGQVRESSESIQVASAEVATGNADLSVRTEQAASSL